MAWKTSALCLTCITHHVNYLGEPTILFLQVQHGDNSFSTHLTGCNLSNHLILSFPSPGINSPSKALLPPSPPSIFGQGSLSGFAENNWSPPQKEVLVCVHSHTHFYILFLGESQNSWGSFLEKPSQKKKSNPELEKTIVMNQKNF